MEGVTLGLLLRNLSTYEIDHKIVIGISLETGLFLSFDCDDYKFDKYNEFHIIHEGPIFKFTSDVWRVVVDHYREKYQA